MLRVRASRDGGGRTDFIMVSKLVLTFACDASNDKAWITSSCEINLKDAAGFPDPLLYSGCHPFSSPASRGAFFARGPRRGNQLRPHLEEPAKRASSHVGLSRLAHFKDQISGKPEICGWVARSGPPWFETHASRAPHHEGSACSEN